jgi:hypothetical protein
MARRQGRLGGDEEADGARAPRGPAITGERLELARFKRALKTIAKGRQVLRRTGPALDRTGR